MYGSIFLSSLFSEEGREFGVPQKTHIQQIFHTCVQQIKISTKISLLLKVVFASLFFFLKGVGAVGSGGGCSEKRHIIIKRVI